MKASDKSPTIEKFLSSLLGKSRIDTIDKGECMTCQATPVGFRDDLSLKEYTISGMCQTCQDKTFGR